MESTRSVRLRLIDYVVQLDHLLFIFLLFSFEAGVDAADALGA